MHDRPTVCQYLAHHRYTVPVSNLMYILGGSRWTLGIRLEHAGAVVAGCRVCARWSVDTEKLGRG